VATLHARAVKRAAEILGEQELAARLGVSEIELRMLMHRLAKDGYPMKGGRVVYTKYDALQEYLHEPGVGNWIAKGRIALALVISHDCDLDDVRDTERIMVAPVHEITRVTSGAEDRERIMRGARPTYVALPGVPRFGDCYAELRSLCPLDRHLFSLTTSRLCSMTDEAVALLRAQLVHYFTRLDPTSS